MSKKAADYNGPIDIPGNRSPHEFAEHIKFMADAHAGFGWSFYLRTAARLIIAFGPDTATWRKEHGASVFKASENEPSPVSLHNPDEEWWRPLHQLPEETCELEFKYASGLIRTEKHLASYGELRWEKLGALAWRRLSADSPKAKLPAVLPLAEPERPKLRVRPVPTDRELVRDFRHTPPTAPQTAPEPPAAGRVRPKPVKPPETSLGGLLGDAEE